VASIAVVLTGDIVFPVALLILTLVPLFGLTSDKTAWRSVARRTSSILAVVYLIFFPIDWLYLSQRLIFATVHLMFYLKLHTLLHQDTHRERNRLHLICLFEMLAAASMTVEARFFFPLTVFVLIGTLVLVLEQTRPRIVDAALLRPSVVSAMSVAIPILVVSGLVFVALPRATYGGFRLGGVQGLTITGFSEEVRLGAFEEIKRSRDIVMRIVTDDETVPSAPRWRGPAYDRYVDGGWTQSMSGVSSLPRTPEGGFLLDRRSTDVRVTSRVLLEPLDTDVIFLPPASATIWTTERFVFVDPYLTLRTGRSARAGRRYNVHWRPQQPFDSSAMGGGERLSERQQRLYTRLPPLSDRFRALADEVIGVRSGLAAARAVETHLKTKYGYSLREPRSGEGDPVEDFLFDARAGHCEYFATAMVLMLRARAIPSRFVTGFSRGRKNALSEFEIVRRTNAHAWVEVFDESRGWVAFDPTPPAPDEDVGASNFFTEGIDSLRMLWDLYVVAFDAERQRGVWGRAGTFGEQAVSAVSTLLDHGRRYALHATLVAAFGLLVVVLARTKWGYRLFLRIPKPRRRIARRPEVAVRFYERLLTRLERLGVVKPDASTPIEFASEMEAALPGMTEVTELYYRVRYGGETLPPNDTARAERLSAAICLAAMGDRGSQGVNA
jgi:transglutaminase-like putative cysteine protease